MATLSPMMQQYMQTKDKYPGTLLFFRVGDFYEMFFDDALTGSRELELTLTGKDCGLQERAPMCGVPYRAVDAYVSRLVQKGYRVAICEQMTDPALSNGLVERDVIRIITPGTLTDSSVIGEKRNCYIAAVCQLGKRYGLAFADVSTGEFYAQQFSSEQDFTNAVTSLSPAEIVADKRELVDFSNAPITEFRHSAFAQTSARETLLKHFKVGTLLALGLDQSLAAAVCAAGALMKYLDETQKNALEHITSLRIREKNDAMPLDPSTRRNLELTETLRSHAVSGSLLSVLDYTVTAMGGRTLASWVERPLIDKARIERRLDAVQALFLQPVLAQTLRETLQNVYDMERLLSKVSYKTLSARDCLALHRSLEQAPEILSLLSPLGVPLAAVTNKINPLPELTDLLGRAISPDAPLAITDGNIIRAGYSSELDELRSASTEGKNWLMALETREREATGIKKLKIQYNRVFGYYIEVTKSYLSLVPLRYRRRQTLAGSERYTTDELSEIEKKITGAEEQSIKLEYALFEDIRAQIADHILALQSTAEGFKTLDALLSLTRAALENRYVRPEITDGDELHIVDGRHPVVERNLSDNAFVPNDTLMDDSRRMQIVTGPNMAGKSTYMRQVALIALMAQMGSFVPATSAVIPLFDCVYTRVGASDDLASGQSTFMVEMSETAHILRNATAKSLVILDEIGRGTSTFDGLAIAWSVVEYLADKKKSGAKTLFATHYHELSELEGHIEGVVNMCVSVKEHGEEVIFLRKIVPGGADKSFGVYVARLAGVPRQVVARAQEIEARLEVNNINQNTIGQNILADKKSNEPKQVELSIYAQSDFIEELRGIDVLSLTPMEALNRLFLIHEKALKL